MVQPSRRQVLGFGVAAAAASAGPVVLADRALAAILPTRLARKTFHRNVGSAFRFSDRGAWYTATLSSVGDLANSRVGDEYRFRLVFTVRGTGPAQGTYRFEHARLAPFQMFVVPVGGGRRLYEAVVFAR